MHLHRRGPGMEITASFSCFLAGETGPLLLELLWRLLVPCFLLAAFIFLDPLLS